MVLAGARHEQDSRFSTVEELEDWVRSATDEEIVAMFESSGPLTEERAEYGRGLIEAAKARLETSQDEEPVFTAAVAD